MKSYLGDVKLKKAMIAEMEKHEKADEIIKGTRSQKIVSEMLKNKGFEVAEVNHPNTNGIDILKGAL